MHHSFASIVFMYFPLLDCCYNGDMRGVESWRECNHHIANRSVHLNIATHISVISTNIVNPLDVSVCVCVVNKTFLFESFLVNLLCNCRSYHIYIVLMLRYLHLCCCSSFSC